MTTEEKATILEGAKAAFFEAMIDGYVGGENRRSVKVKDDDGYTTITYTTEDGKYEVEDRFCTTPFSDKSAGTTTILYRFPLIWVPVWWMSYGGHYPERATPFLKLALKRSYGVGLFNYGRGPDQCIDVSFDMGYTNIGTGDFERFQGTEEILDLSTNRTIGFHKYFGMSLL